MKNTQRAAAIFRRLRRRYPQTETALRWRAPWELLVATILAAQCADARVNTVTPELFRRWPGPAELAAAGQEDVEAVVRPTGFFRSKARNLIAAARRINERFGGKVPDSMADLTSLPGVARKTANIVLSNAFGKNEGLAVDTHVRRLSLRLGLTASQDVKVIERDLMPLFPRKEWGEVNHLLVFFGREVCRARTPRCPACELADLCPRRGLPPLA